jgi:hypothetical protein
VPSCWPPLASGAGKREREREVRPDPFSFTGARAPHNPVNKKLIENLHGGYFLYRVSGQEITHAPGVIKSGGSARTLITTENGTRKLIFITNFVLQPYKDHKGEEAFHNMLKAKS